MNEDDLFGAAVEAGERLRQASEKLSSRLEGKPWDPWKTLEEWQREEEPEWEELQRAIAENNEAARRLAATFERRFGKS
jgi:hypothetical protein